MSSRSRMVNASPVSSAPSLDVASANLRVPCGPSSVRRQAAIDPSASALPAGLAEPAEPAEVTQKPENGAPVTRAGNRDGGTHAKQTLSNRIDL